MFWELFIPLCNVKIAHEVIQMSPHIAAMQKKKKKMGKLEATGEDKDIKI